jgi:hypothetical protein
MEEWNSGMMQKQKTADRMQNTGDWIEEKEEWTWAAVNRKQCTVNGER